MVCYWFAGYVYVWISFTLKFIWYLSILIPLIAFGYLLRKVFFSKKRVKA
jgi:hypothetical protein